MPAVLEMQLHARQGQFPEVHSSIFSAEWPGRFVFGKVHLEYELEIGYGIIVSNRDVWQHLLSQLRKPNSYRKAFGPSIAKFDTFEAFQIAPSGPFAAPVLCLCGIDVPPCSGC
jgi:hypothetical protein